MLAQLCDVSSSAVDYKRPIPRSDAVELDPQAPEPVAASEDKPVRKYAKRTAEVLDQPEETPEF